MTDYRQLARAAMAKCCGYDPYFPERSDVMVSAWSEALERAGMDDEGDVLEAVTRMYGELGLPGWRPTPKVLVQYAQQVWRERLYNERQVELQVESSGGPKKTFAEFRRDNPDVVFPKFGKEIPDG